MTRRLGKIRQIEEESGKLAAIGDDRRPIPYFED
jgi:hypothetical protein